MTTGRTCPGVRRVPIENIKPAPTEWQGTFARRYGIAHCMICKKWVTAHKDGTPVWHGAPPVVDERPRFFGRQRP